MSNLLPLVCDFIQFDRFQSEFVSSINYFLGQICVSQCLLFLWQKFPIVFNLFNFIVNNVSKSGK